MTRTHTVAWGPVFLPGTSEGPMACSCGWTGLYVKGYRTDTFTEHRAAMGLRTANPAHTFAAEQYPGVFARKDPKVIAERCQRDHAANWRINNQGNRVCRDCEALHKARYRARVAAA